MSERLPRYPIGKILVVIGIIGGGWGFSENFQIEGLDRLRVSSRPGDAEESDAVGLPWATSSPGQGNPRAALAVLARDQKIPSVAASHRLDVQENGEITQAPSEILPDPLAQSSQAAIRVASWALAGFDRNKLAKPYVMDWFARVVRSVDVIALQQITSRERDLLPRIVEHVNRTGRRYDFLLGPVVTPAQLSDASGVFLGEQYAFLFDTETIETDRGQLYTVEDPGEQLSYDPLVGWFRARGEDPSMAWTFTLVNMRVDSNRAASEVPVISSLMSAVAADGRGEDDLLLAGMFQTDERQLVALLGGEACEAAVIATPTDIFGKYQLSNLLSPKRTTTESLGSGGVIDFVRLFGLNPAQAEELSPHLPVFAEFSPREGS